MRRYWVLIVLAMAASGCLLCGCAKSPGDPAPATTTAAAQEDPLIPTQAQPKLATIKLWIGREQMTAEMAITELQDRTGMMFRTNMDENEGMIFVFNVPQRASFWMKNCTLPLSAAYIDADGRILEIRALQPQDTNSVVSDHDNIQFVLETKQGWFDRHNIKPGTVIATEKGSLKKTFLDNH